MRNITSQFLTIFYIYQQLFNLQRCCEKSVSESDGISCRQNMHCDVTSLWFSDSAMSTIRGKCQHWDWMTSPKHSSHIGVVRFALHNFTTLDGRDKMLETTSS